MATVSKGVFRAAVSEARELLHQLNIRDCKILELEIELRDQAHAAHGVGFKQGYDAGYSARDKLSCASCGDGGKVEPR